MRRTLLAVCAALTLPLTACTSGETTGSLPDDPKAAEWCESFKRMENSTHAVEGGQLIADANDKSLPAAERQAAADKYNALIKLPANESTDAECAGPVWDRFYDETKKSVSATAAAPKITATRQPADAAGFLKELGVGNGDLLKVEPMKQAEIICGQLDAGQTPVAVADQTLVRLRTDYATKSSSKFQGWDAFEAKVLTHRSAKYVCPDHEAAVTAAAKGW